MQLSLYFIGGKLSDPTNQIHSIYPPPQNAKMQDLTPKTTKKRLILISSVYILKV
jgi:hypothetical protein